VAKGGVRAAEGAVCRAAPAGANSSPGKGLAL
jgi:hypothetical protein